MYTNKPYEANSVDFEQQITSVKLDPSAYASLPLTLEELRVHWQTRGISFTDVQRKIFAQLQLVARAVLPHVCKNARVCPKHVRFQLFGADVILTDRLEPYLLEFNKGPQMNPVNARDRTVKRSVLEDTFALAGVISLPSGRRNGFTRLAAV